MHSRCFLPLLLGSLLHAFLLPAAEPEPVLWFDATYLFKLDLQDPAQRRRHWDESHLLTALQGLANRQSPRLFIRYLREPDDFWWGEMTASHGWLAGRAVEKIATLEILLERLRPIYRGVVYWDERVPATSNLASTVAGCDDLLPIRYDTSPGSLCQRLSQLPGLAVQKRLIAPDGGPLFTGKGTIPETTIPSTGSAKCDAYLWLVEHYVRPGLTDPHRLGYYLDGWWLRSWRASGPENHTLSNQDYVIAHRGVLFDLGVWDDEAPIDEPDQPAGTDVATLKKLLRAVYDQTRGEGMIHVAGFVPWAYKYTWFKSGEITAGGHHEEVATEWRYAEILSCFNAFMDADALGLGAMANASFFQHYPLEKKYPQPARPTRASLVARGVLQPDGRVPRRTFVAHYVGDYDAAAWLYQELPKKWRDPARGQVPLSWAFNPNLAERFPLGMAWARARATSNDWFIAGDSGAGYLNPGYLTPPRPHSGLPSGLAAWEKHCRAFYEQWDLSLTGFVIDGNARALAPETLDAYARFSPDGIVAQKIPKQGRHGDMPFLRMATDLPDGASAAAKMVAGMAAGGKPRFLVCRSILKAPRWYAELSAELRKQAGDTVQIVDMYTLLWLVGEYEQHRQDYVDLRFAKAAQVRGAPGKEEGVTPVAVADGPFETSSQPDGQCWKAGGGKKTSYLYFDADDEFCRSHRGRLTIAIEFREPGNGQIMLEYDSTDPRAPVEGAYKLALPTASRGQGTGWRRVSWDLPDARCAGSQNGHADFRLVVQGDPLEVRGVTVHRAP